MKIFITSKKTTADVSNNFLLCALTLQAGDLIPSTYKSLTWQRELDRAFIFSNNMYYQTLEPTK